LRFVRDRAGVPASAEVDFQQHEANGSHQFAALDGGRASILGGQGSWPLALPNPFGRPTLQPTMIAETCWLERSNARL
jgi:hypothetical protein